jgi:hypothetical protein
MHRLNIYHFKLLNLNVAQSDSFFAPVHVILFLSLTVNMLIKHLTQLSLCFQCMVYQATLGTDQRWAKRAWPMPKLVWHPLNQACHPPNPRLAHPKVGGFWPKPCLAEPKPMCHARQNHPGLIVPWPNRQYPHKVGSVANDLIGQAGLGYVPRSEPRPTWPIKPPGQTPKPLWRSATRDLQLCPTVLDTPYQYWANTIQHWVYWDQNMFVSQY